MKRSTLAVAAATLLLVAYDTAEARGRSAAGLTGAARTRPGGGARYSSPARITSPGPATYYSAPSTAYRSYSYEPGAGDYSRVAPTCCAPQPSCCAPIPSCSQPVGPAAPSEMTPPPRSVSPETSRRSFSVEPDQQREYAPIREERRSGPGATIERRLRPGRGWSR